MGRRSKNTRDRREERELDRLVGRTGLKGSAREMAAQYGRGMLEGMHIAYLAVTERLLRAGNTREEIVDFLDDLMDTRQIDALLAEAAARLQPEEAEEE